MTERWTNYIPVARAKILRNRGWSWKKIGEELAKEIGRPTPFKPESVQSAVKRDNPKYRI